MGRGGPCRYAGGEQTQQIPPVGRNDNAIGSEKTLGGFVKAGKRLDEIPPEVYGYRLGNRSALEWIIDQYQVSTDKRSGISNDPNREDDPTYILRLIGQVITVSLETVRIVKSLPEWAVALSG